jgi:Na+/proline symporter
MSAAVLLAIILAYFALLWALAWATSRQSDNESFFIGNRNSRWWLVAFGMVGTSLSGVTFVSVPGTVGRNGFGYLQVVIGNWIGFVVIALVLLPLYYRLRLTSIYGFLGQRFGDAAQRTGAGFFLLSRTLGATARLYLVAAVLQLLVADRLGIPFAVSAAAILFMIWVYTFKGGVKTIVFTDTLQTAFMLGGLVICASFLAINLAGGVADGVQHVLDSAYARVWNTDSNAASFWLKQIAGGAFIAIAMSGLDQEMMQKNISVATLRDSQKNMLCFSLVLVAVNVLFLVLGALLAMHAAAHGVTATGDRLFPSIVMDYFPPWIQAVFFIALISALFPSADGALTALTSSFCLDIVRIEQRTGWDETRQRRLRLSVHAAFTMLFFALVLAFRAIDNRSIIDAILILAAYTYGPLLGLFCFGLLTQRRLPNAVPILAACIVAPMASFALQRVLAANPAGYQIGIELLLINGAITVVLLWLASKPGENRDTLAVRTSPSP